MSAMGPAAVARLTLQHFVTHDMEAFCAAFADDAVMEFPFAPADRPRVLHGRAAVEEYLQGYTDLLDVREILDVNVLEDVGGTDVVVEFSARGVVVATSAHYTARYVAVITVVDGQIQHYRDYWDPTTFAKIPVGAATPR